MTQRLGGQVRLFALDLLPVKPLPGVTVIQGDVRESVVRDELLTQLGLHKVDLVMSDMAPNMRGIKAVDRPRVIELAELARDFAFDVLANDGHLLTKVFQGEGFEAYVKTLKAAFRQMVIRKPEASRLKSSEIYVLAKHYVK